MTALFALEFRTDPLHTAVMVSWRRWPYQLQGPGDCYWLRSQAYKCSTCCTAPSNCLIRWGRSKVLFPFQLSPVRGTSELLNSNYFSVCHKRGRMKQCLWSFPVSKEANLSDWISLKFKYAMNLCCRRSDLTLFVRERIARDVMNCISPSEFKWDSFSYAHTSSVDLGCNSRPSLPFLQVHT